MARISTLKVKNESSVKLGMGVKWGKGEVPVRLVIRQEGELNYSNRKLKDSPRYVVCKETLEFDTDEGCFVHVSFYGGNYDAGGDWLKAQNILIDMMRDA